MNDLIGRQAAIDAVLELRDCPNGYSDAYDKSEIIALLEEVPSAQQNTCEYWDSESNFCALCRPSAQPEWNEMIVICDCCGHAIHVERQ